jgi:pimeloyl-ACP methyl ester carboxylesterase
MLPGWQSVQIEGKNADAFASRLSPPRFALIYLHGVGQETLADKPVYSNLLDELGFQCVCPRGDQAWWSDRICSSFDAVQTAERFVIQNVTRWIGDQSGIGPRGIGLFGISMGGQGALRIAFKHPSVFPVVAAIAPAIEYHECYGQGSPLDDMYDSKEQCRQDTALMHIHPSEQPRHIFFCCDPDDEQWHRGADRLHEKLSALGVGHEFDLTTRAGGHTWQYYDRVADRVLRFLLAGLEHESRRLL